MGAYYELLVAPAARPEVTLQVVCDFLTSRNMPVICVMELGTADIPGHNAILISPPANGWVEIVSGSEVGADASWYDRNPLAIYLSTRLQACIHLWSLNSGWVGGYALYQAGVNVECDCIFCEHAIAPREIMDGVPTPFVQHGKLLEQVLGLPESFAEFVSRYKCLEIAVGEFIGQIGFPVHLLDYFDATDDLEGIQIQNGRYEAIELRGWTAILFDRTYLKSQERP